MSLLKFGAKWCGPCKKIQPFVETLESKFPGLVVLYIDIDEDSDNLCDKYNIDSLPTFVLLIDDKEAGRVSGIDKQELSKLLEKYHT
jgi:thioredoxin 1